MPDAKLPEGLEGTCDDRFAGVADLLAKQIAGGEHHGAAFAAYFRGEPVIDIWGGMRNSADGETPWRSDTMAICFSTTKGVTATALHMAMERSGTSYDTPVAKVWPGFGANGKEKITIRHLLCHEAGIPQIRDRVDDCWSMTDWDAMVGVMESLEPLWEPGTANGYHAINYGWLVGETLRRIDGRDLPTFLAEEIAGPLELDGAYIGTPPAVHHRIAPHVGPQEADGMDQDAEYDARLPHDSILWKALAPRGRLIDFFASEQGMSSCIPSISGAFTARSLAKLYAALERGGEVDGTRILERESVQTATTVQNERPDLVIIVTPRWRLGYMSGGGRFIPILGPNDDAYGHVGAGGTFAAADPKAELSFALVYDKFGATELLGSARGMALSYEVVRAAEAAK